MNTCIYCKKDAGENAPPEHIVPESLGCPQEFVLRSNEVCQHCNNGPLARLEVELNDTFGISKVTSILRNKKGKHSSVQSNNLYAENDDGHVHIHLNFEKHPIRLGNGKVLAPMQKNSFVTKQKLDVVDDVATLNFQIPMIRSKQTSRALHKLAFGTLCYFLGRDLPYNSFLMRFALLLFAAKEKEAGWFNAKMLLPSGHKDIDLILPKLERMESI